ncbi:MAG: fumarylacetoacetase [Gammaproteobacteria bacterium]|nr:fumarylacetoacetase [Gammaproteobacteria bacterium]
MSLNETHDPSLTSWVESANIDGADFPLQNLPFAVFRVHVSDESFRGGVAIGDQVLDLARLAEVKAFNSEINELLQLCAGPELNAFMARGAPSWSTLRLALSRALREGSALQDKLQPCLVAQELIEFSLPCRIGDYTDFYTSINHATNVGKLFRPDNPLLPNYKWVPIGYHGRASSIGVSGQQIRRPLGQTKAPDADIPSFGPCQRLDYETEVGIFIGAGNALGERIAIDDADSQVFGYCIFNDWSARDIQAWEYQPLGPFLSKSFASTISPWIVTSEALLPYHVEWSRSTNDPQPLDYLDSAANRNQGAIDLKLQTYLHTAQMRKAGEQPHLLGESNFAQSYWSVAQMVTHHTVNGCNLQPGDFFGSGTQSGESSNELGSMLEITQGGKQELVLPNGETRKFLADGDCIIMSGYCEKPGAAHIGFGSASATIQPATNT